MSEIPDRSCSVPRWLHGWAILTAVAALPLVTLGAEVTTRQVGMADPAGLREPWYFFTLNLRETPLGPLIEHGHRQLGWIVGLCCIVLAIGLTVAARRTWQRWLGWAALAAVSVQGVLGIFRVNLHALLGSSLSTIHGCFAQITFAILVAVAVLTSRTWATPLPASADLARCRSLALVLAGLTYVQIVFGAIMRHLYDRSAQRLHILLAFLVVGLAVWLVRDMQQARPDRTLRRMGWLLLAFLVIQPMLGLEAYLRRFGVGTLPELVPASPMLDLVRSAHHVLGTLTFATVVALNLFLRRPRPVVAVAADPLEGAA
jgi:cytochrome c oxidase assembly protein subunit 15